MRWLCLALLAANVVYFFWEFNQAVRNDAGATLAPIPESVEPLMLASEMRASAPRPGSSQAPKPEPPPMTDPVAPGPDTGASKRCFTIGPFPTETEANAAQVWIGSGLIATQRRPQADVQSTRYWVYVDEDSTEAAQASIERLRGLGVKDYLLTRGADKKPLISLGVYSNKASLDSRLAELEKNGIKASVQPRTKGRMAYWVDVIADQGDPKIGEAQARYSGQLSVADRPCSEIAGAAGNP
ncbi:MAG: hypothetical protein ACREWG_09215 [Gammaproteobacteria bacterium]